MQKGLQVGILKGIHNGSAKGQMLSGMKQGMHKSTGIKDKTNSQDPSLLKGVKKPLIFCLGDYYTQPDNITTTLLDIANTGYTLFCNAGGSIRPAPIQNDIFNKFTSMDFQSNSSYLIPNPTLNLTGYNAITTIMVVKLKKIAATAIFTLDDTTTPGGLNVNIKDTLNNVETIYYGGQPGSVTNSNYNTFTPSAESEDWMMISVKCRLGQPQGPGSEQETYINGRLQKRLISSNFNVITTSYVSGQNIIVGNDNSILSGSKGNGIKLGGIVILPYWATSSEQMRIENYFRSYYGHRF